MKQLYFSTRTSHVLCVKFRFIFLLTILLVTCNVFGQTSNCNNNAGGEISVNSSCTYTSMDSNNDSDYWNGASGCNTSDRDDVWAWFEATSTTTIITYNPDTRDAILTLFNSACNQNMSSIACADDYGDGGAETITLTTVIGETYRIRVQRYNSNGGMSGDICVYSPGITYCTPSSSSSALYIDDFSTTGGLTNITNNSSGTGITSNGYSDYMAQSVSQIQGGTVNFSADFEYAPYDSHGFNIWIDFNDNGDFTDAGEKVYASGGYVTSPTGSFNIPAAAPIGSHRMRIRGDYYSTDPNSCNNISYGEAEDYTLNITTSTPCSQPTTQPTALILNPSDTTITGSFTAASPAPDSYLVVYNTTNTTPNPVDGTAYTIGDTVGAGNIVADTDGNTNFSVSGLAGSTTYYFFVYSYNNSACSTNYLSTNPLTSNTTTLISYCIPQGSASTDRYIDDFTATGTNTLTNNNTGYSTGGYGNFSSTHSVSQIQGGAINFSATLSGVGYRFFIWIDWNNDGDFNDDGELVINPDTRSLFHTGTFIIPIAASPGDHRMRIRNYYNNPTSCGVNERGEAEDYTLTVTESSPCSQPTTQPTALILNPTDTSVTGSFTAASPAPDSYLVVYNTTNTTPNPTDGTTYIIGDTIGTDNTVADTDGNTNFSVSGLSSSTTYYFFVFSYNNSACSTNYLSTSSLTNNATTLISYCIPQGTASVDRYIDDFTATGTNTLTNNNTGYSTGGYGNFSSTHSVSQIQGGAINFSATLSGAAYRFFIWVDWNDDGDFNDADELVINPSTRSFFHTGTFDIPIAASPGGHRMRIRNYYWNPTPCGTNERGEAEDYTLIVIQPNCTADPENLTVISTTTSTATVSWNASTPPPGNGYEYIVSTDNTTATPTGDIIGTTIGTSINLTGLAIGTTYYVFVRGVCNTTDNGIWITVSFNTGCTDLDTTPNSSEMIIDEVGTNPFTATPYNPNPSFKLDCDVISVELATNAQIYETTSYDVIKIPYATLSSFGATINNTPIADDDLWATSPTALGFPFCFYDNEYEYTLAGANSMLTFDIDAPGAPYFMTGNNTPGSSCGFGFDNNLPSTVGSLFEQTIYGVYHDIDPRGLPANALTTRTQGMAGSRMFIAEWKDIPMYGDDTRLYSGKMVLYETTNIIEVHIEEKRIENGDNSPWNDGNAIVGIQGDYVGPATNPANEYAVAPCRNGLDTNWETTNEAWRFVPSGNSRLTGVEWYIGTDTSGAPDATTNTYTATAPGTYTAVSTYSSCGGSTVSLTDEVVITSDRKTWNGSLNSNWYSDSNWTPYGVPTSADCVTIPNPVTTSNRSPIVDKFSGLIFPFSSAEARNLALLSGAYLEIESKTELILQDWVNVQNTGVLNLKSSSSLIQVDNFATNSGEIYMQRSPNYDESIVSNTEYVYWSSPVANFQVTDISPASSQIYNWTPTVANGTSGNHGQWLSASGTMTDGTGYIVRGLGETPTKIPATTFAISNNTALFSGEPNNGIITKSIFHGGWNGGSYSGIGDTATNEDDNWNLIGNPHPSAISANAFTNLNTNINGTVYVWPHKSTYSAATVDPFYEDYAYNYDGNDYIEHNNTGSNPPGTNDFFISSGQAFFVMMNHSATSGTSVTFNNSMRQVISSYNNDTFFRTTDLENDTNTDTVESCRIWLDLLSPNDITNTLLVGYVPDATNSFDRLYDGYDFSSGDNSGFYSIVEDQTLSIQGRSLPFLQEDTVPLGIIANETGNHTIAINTLDGLFITESQNIYIEDTALNIIHDMRLSPYTFTIEEGVHNDRFILRYTNETLSVNQLDDIDSVSIVAPKNEYIKITSNKNVIKDVVVYDLLGRVLINRKNSLKSEVIINDINNASGAYIIKVTLVNGLQKTQKVILK